MQDCSLEKSIAANCVAYIFTNMDKQGWLQLLEVKITENTFLLLACVSTSLLENFYLGKATGYAKTLKIHEIFPA